MLSEFALDYAVLVFVSTLGVLQIVAASNGLVGVLFLRNAPRASVALGAVLVVAAFTWFFASEFRNLPDTGEGLDANQQAAWFAVSAGAAVALTLFATSLTNRGWALRAATDEIEWKAGLSALQRTTFLVALGVALKDRRKRSVHG